MKNTLKALALTLAITAGLGAAASSAFAAHGYHWAYPTQYIGR